MSTFSVFLLLGLVSGSLTALVAFGVVVAYRASRIVNFSASALGAVSAYLTYNLRDDGIPALVAICIGLAVGALLGLITWLAMAVVRSSSILIKFMVTLGLFTAAQAFILLVWGPNTTTPVTFLPKTGISLGGPLEIGTDRLILMAAALSVAVILATIYRRTVFGLATSAVSESHVFLASSGWSPARIEVANFVVSGVLASFAAICLAPIIGLNGSTLALLIVPALSASLVGRFESFAVILAAALAIGAAESLLSYYDSDIAGLIDVSAETITWLPNAVPLAVILILTMIRGTGRPQRGETQAWLPNLGDGRIPLLPLAFGVAALAALLAFAPSWSDAMVATAAGAMLVLSVVVVTGLAGQFSLCQYALAGFGGWVAASLAANVGFPFPLALLLGVFGAIAAGLAVALPALRARGMTLAIATLALALLLNVMIFTNSSLTGGYNGLDVGAPSLLGLSLDPLDHPERYAAFGFLLLLVSSLIAANVRRGRAGLRLVAIRSNEAAAASLGVGVYGAKLYAFSLAAGVAGLAGAYLAFQYPTAQFGDYNAVSSVTLVQFSVLGGLGWISGALAGGAGTAGALLQQLTHEALTQVSSVDTWFALVTGVIVVFALRKAPDGIVSVWASGFNDPRVMRNRIRLGVPVVLWRFLGELEIVTAAVLIVGLVVGPAEYVGALMAIAIAATHLRLELKSGHPDRTRVIASLLVLTGAAVLILLQLGDISLATFVLGQAVAVVLFGEGAAKLSRRMMDRTRLPRPKHDRPLLESPARPPSSLEVDNLTVHFDGVVALDGVSFAVQPGETVGLIGPNGAGKTTLLDVATGFTKPTQGDVLLGGRSILGWSPERIARSGMIRSWQSVGLFEAMTVRENLLVACDSQLRRHYLTDLVRPGAQRWTQVAEEVVGEFGLQEVLDSRPTVLPQGTGRLVGIARSFCASPSVLLLDEPTAGLSTFEAEELFGAIRKKARLLGLGMLVIEHDVPLLLNLCDRLIVLDFGRKIAEGTPDQIERDPRVISAYLGTETVDAA